MANERRLIDVSKLVKPPYAEDDNITGSGMTYDEMCGYNDGIDAVWSMIQHYAPTVDAVEVVRCEDCKHFRCPIRSNTYCNVDVLTDPEKYDFCSRGERREAD